MVPGASAQDTAATQKLKALNPELREDLIRITDSVYTAVGYSVSNVSMIVGTDGIVIVDTGVSPVHAQRILTEFRKISDKPIRAIVFTHGHGDHTNGARVFAGESKPDVWARANFGSETRAWQSIGLRNPQPVNANGLTLPPEKRINNGVAPALYMNQAGAGRPAGGASPAMDRDQPMGSMGAGALQPTRTFDGERQELTVAGVKIVLVAAPGETEDALYVWLPKERVLFAGDNFYRAFPNLYPLRGAQRNAMDWANSVDKMLKEGADYVVPGHTRPVMGREAAARALTDYRDAIRYVFTKTIEGMNGKLTPDELAESVKLPPALAASEYLQEYYGKVSFSVRSVYSQTVGWFDGNATNIAPLGPKEEALRMAALAGGETALLEKAKAALASGDAQWSAQLADFLIVLNKDSREPKTIKAAAMEALAEHTYNAPSRNYYLEYAQMLRRQVEGK
jgi:alkyl sulfatase BDS1-like metallo-beta-lactamase superfamily hydrolase